MHARLLSLMLGLDVCHFLSMLNISEQFLTLSVKRQNLLWKLKSWDCSDNYDVSMQGDDGFENWFNLFWCFGLKIVILPPLIIDSTCKYLTKHALCDVTKLPEKNKL